MKKLFVSAGLAAISAINLHADTTYAPDVTAMDASRIWSLSGTLRGFFDDNYTTSHSDATGKRASWGFEASPSASIIIPLQQTELGLRYTYGLYYYQDRENINQNPIDQSHTADLWIDHAFSERWEAKVQDAFTVAQNPQVGATATLVPYRVNGNNIDNLGTVTVHTEWSMLFSTDVGYQNTWYDYSEHGATTASIAANGPTYAGLLNQDSHSIWLNLNYQFLPDLSFYVGYSFGFADYTGNEPIAQNMFHNIPVPGEFYYSKNRNQYSHNLYVGTQYAATENLSITAQVGFEYSDNYNLPGFDNQSATQFQPTANIAATYVYLPGDYVQLGFTQSESPSDVAQANGNGNITLYQETSVLYASVNHQITPYLLGSIIGHYQFGEYQGGNFSGSGQSWYSLGLNLSYTINPHLSTEIGYNFDYADSGGGAAQSYARNREYLGVTGTF